jgi:DNA-binding transcriptional LysR family regulator
VNMYQIKYFVALAECLSFTQAASSLYVAQPALSRAISSMEEELGIQLFVRNKRSVKLTEAGEVFYRESLDLLSNFDEAMIKVKMAHSGQIGRLKLGYRYDTVNSFLPKLVSRFSSIYKDIKLEMRELALTEISDAFEDGEVDFIIGSSRDIAPEGTDDFLIWAKEEQYAVLPHGHPLSGRESIRINELRDEEFILLNRRDTPQSEIFYNRCIEQGFRPKEAQRAAYSVPDIVMRVACKAGITVLQKSSADMAREIADVIKVDDLPPVERAIIWKKDSRNPCVGKMIPVIRQVISELVEV